MIDLNFPSIFVPVVTLVLPAYAIVYVFVKTQKNN